MENFILKRIHLFIALAALLGSMIVSSAHAVEINGHVLDTDGYPLAGASVVIDGTKIGAATDFDGAFQLSRAPATEITVNVSLIGFKSTTRTLNLTGTENTGDPVHLMFNLELDVLAFEEVTFEADRIESGPFHDGAERVEVITQEDLVEQSDDGGLLSALAGGTGLDTKPCALCGSAGVGMQGLDPSYTEINVDGLPILSGLGALYGLDGIQVSDLEQVEISKGGTRGDAGAGAVAGAVYLVTNSPDMSLADLPTAEVSMMASETGRHNLNGAVTVPMAEMPVRINASYGSEPRHIDRNDDGLTDTPSFTRFNLSLSSNRQLSNGTLTTRVRGYNEERFAGETHWTEDDRGSAEVYGRDIHTQRIDTGISYKSTDQTWGGSYVADAAYVYHQQASWYGTTEYDASQMIGLARIAANRYWTMQHTSMARLQYRYEAYEDNLQLSSETDRTDMIPGLLLQHDWQPSTRWNARASVLNELYDDDGYVATPRASLRFNPTDALTLIGSGGLGYRTVTIFSLDKAAHAGFDNLSVPKELKAERSFGGSVGMQYRTGSASQAFQIDITGFYTRFDNKVIVAFGHAETGEVMYSNAHDAYSQGVELQFAYSINPGWTFNLNGTISDVQYHNGFEWRREEMRSAFTAGAQLAKEWAGSGVRANVDAKVFGPQALPDGRGRSESPTYMIVDLGLRKNWERFALSLKAGNITDYVQPDNVFSVDPSTGQQRIDSAMIYGPQLGRTVSMTLSAKFGA